MKIPTFSDEQILTAPSEATISNDSGSVNQASPAVTFSQQAKERGDAEFSSNVQSVSSTTNQEPVQVGHDAAPESEPLAAASTDSFFQELKEWQLSTFPNETLEQVFYHFNEEIDELKCPTDQNEIADCLMLLFCLCFKQDVDPVYVMRQKHIVNLTRKWKKTERGFRHEKSAANYEGDGAKETPWEKARKQIQRRAASEDDLLCDRTIDEIIQTACEEYTYSEEFATVHQETLAHATRLERHRDELKAKLAKTTAEAHRAIQEWRSENDNFARRIVALQTELSQTVSREVVERALELMSQCKEGEAYSLLQESLNQKGGKSCHPANAPVPEKASTSDAQSTTNPSGGSSAPKPFDPASDAEHARASKSLFNEAFKEELLAEKARLPDDRDIAEQFPPSSSDIEVIKINGQREGARWMRERAQKVIAECHRDMEINRKENANTWRSHGKMFNEKLIMFSELKAAKEQLSAAQKLIAEWDDELQRERKLSIKVNDMIRAYTALVQKSRTWELELSAAQKAAQGYLSRVQDLERENAEVKTVAFQSQEMAKEISEQLEQERRNSAEMKSARDFWIGKYNEAVTSPPSPEPK
jgi:hypothetical protein